MMNIGSSFPLEENGGIPPFLQFGTACAMLCSSSETVSPEQPKEFFMSSFSTLTTRLAAGLTSVALSIFVFAVAIAPAMPNAAGSGMLA